MEIMDNKEFLEDFSKLLEVNVEELTNSFSLVDCALWDSLSIVNTIGLVDQHFNKSVSGAKLSTCKKFGDLLELII